MKGFSKSYTAFEKSFVVVAIILYCGAILPLMRLVANGDVDVDLTDGDIVLQMAFSSLYFVTFILLISSKTQSFASIVKSNRGLFFLILIICSSFIWSASPLVCLRRIAGIIGTSLFGFYIAMRFSFYDFLRLFYRALLIIAVLSILTAVLLPNYGIHHDYSALNGTWRGVFTHKNHLGRAMVIFAIVSFCLLHYTRSKKYYLGIALAFFLIIFSKSATAILILLALLTFGYYLRSLKGNINAVYLKIIVFLVLVVSATIFFISNYAFIFAILDKDPTLTGRTFLWQKLMDMVNQSPLLGYGYGSFWLGDTGPSSIIWRQVGWEPPQAHNGFIDLMLDLGYVGLLVFLYIFLSSYFNYIKEYVAKKNMEYLWGILFITFMIIYNFSESGIMRTNDVFWILLIFTLTSYNKKVKRTFVPQFTQ